MAVQTVPKGFPSPRWRNPFSSHILLGFGGDWGPERGRAAHPPRQGPTGALQHQSRVVAWVFWGLLRHFMVPLAMVIWGAPIAHWGPACAQGWGGWGLPRGCGAAVSPGTIRGHWVPVQHAQPFISNSQIKPFINVTFIKARATT